MTARLAIAALAIVVLALALAPTLAGATAASTEDARPAALREVGIDQRLGESLPLDAAFRDEDGRSVTLGDYFGAKPVVLVLTYYECPMLCTLVLNGLTKTLKTLAFEPGKEFDVVAVSFDPKDTPALAAKKKAAYVADYGRAASAAGWHFLTGDEAAIARVATAVGFRYRWVPEEKQFAHAAAIVLATPDGRLARYFYGIDYAPRDLRLGLVEAADRKIGSAVDALLLFCYQYDPATGKYGAFALNLVRAGGVATVLALGAFMIVMFRREALARRSHQVHVARASSVRQIGPNGAPSDAGDYLTLRASRSEARVPCDCSQQGPGETCGPPASRTQGSV